MFGGLGGKLDHAERRFRFWLSESAAPCALPNEQESAFKVEIVQSDAAYLAGPQPGFRR